jgi:hypothetical protein
MPSTTQANTVSANNASAGVNPWVNPTLANNPDDDQASPAIAEIPNNVDMDPLNSNWLVMTGFGFSLPNSTISGIEVVNLPIGYFDANGIQPANLIFALVKNGTVQATTKTFVSSSFTSAGGSADLWSNTWTASDINASNFGVALRCTCPSPSAKMLVSGAYLRITYTIASKNFLFHPF